MKIIDIMYEDLPLEYDENSEIEDEILIRPHDFADDDAIIIYSPFYRVKNIGLILGEGVFCYTEEDTGELVPDWSLTIIYDDIEDDDFDPAKYLYFEQGTEMSAIHNFCQYRGY